MDLMKLQNLLNECIMIEQGNYLGVNFSVDLAEAQAELDQAKQLLIPRVVKSFYCYDKTVANAEEDYDFKQCDKQCENCKQ